MHQAPKFDYSCSTCHGPAVKKPCGTQRKMTKRGVTDEEYTGLHGWKCMKCGPGVKVARKVRKREEPTSSV